jgi:hypothetical protein
MVDLTPQQRQKMLISKWFFRAAILSIHNAGVFDVLF